MKNYLTKRAVQNEAKEQIKNKIVKLNGKNLKAVSKYVGELLTAKENNA